jgi:hypothetical protein
VSIRAVSIEAAKEIGISAKETALRLQWRPSRAARETGGEPGTAIRKAVTGTIAGIKVIAKEPFNKEK